MKQSEHVMIDNAVPHMSAHYAAAQLELVRQMAARTCSTLADQRAFRTAEWIIANRCHRASGKPT